LVTISAKAADFAGQLLPPGFKVNRQGQHRVSSTALILFKFSPWHGFCSVNGEAAAWGSGGFGE
jgi:hypothetical protein